MTSKGISLFAFLTLIHHHRPLYQLALVLLVKHPSTFLARLHLDDLDTTRRYVSHFPSLRDTRIPVGTQTEWLDWGPSATRPAQPSPAQPSSVRLSVRLLIPTLITTTDDLPILELALHPGTRTYMRTLPMPCSLCFARQQVSFLEEQEKKRRKKTPQISIRSIETTPYSLPLDDYLPPGRRPIPEYVLLVHQPDPSRPSS